MLYLVVYDIPDDKIRNRIADELEGRGSRVQESVFECRTTDGKARRIAERLQRILGDAAGNIRVYQICSDCGRQSVGVGDLVRVPPEKGYLIA